MADVRSMLRQERAARQQATNAPARPKPQAVPAARAGQKRKAHDDEHEDRKRTKAEEVAGLPSGFFDGGANPADDQQEDPAAEEEDHQEADISDGKTVSTSAKVVATDPAPPQSPPLESAPFDEDEWAAFERDVAAEPVPSAPQSRSIDALAAISAAPTISAAPLTAEQLAVQAREEQSQQRGRRDAELEAEKEDAARHLEEEFDEMEELEERVRKLRQKREALRKVQPTTTDVSVPSAIPDLPEAPDASQVPKVGLEEESDEELEEDEWGDWRYRTA